MAIFKDELFQAQWLRTAGHATYGGAEIAECLTIAKTIHELDAESWYTAWAGFAERLVGLAQESQNRGRLVSARDAYLRASNYWRAAYTFLIGPKLDPRVAHAYRRQRAAFEAGASLMRPSAERVSISYETGALHGYFFRGGEDSARRPTVIINGGYDSTAEECFFFSGAAAVARGYNCLVFDGPGQGAAIIEDRLAFRPD